jgi:hypothetical protein
MWSAGKDKICMQCLVAKHEGNGPYGRQRSRWVDNTTMDSEGGMDLIRTARQYLANSIPKF